MRSSSTLKISPGDWSTTDARGVCFVGRFRGGIDEYATITQWRQAICRAFSACAPKVPLGARYRQRPSFPVCAQRRPRGISVWQKARTRSVTMCRSTSLVTA